MKINFPTLSNYAKDIHGIAISTALGITHRQWCGPMGVKGFCTEDCSKCAAHLEKAFRLEDAKNPAALLNWSLKNELAAVQEEQSIHVFVPVNDAFGNPKPTSEHILNDISDGFNK